MAIFTDIRSMPAEFLARGDRFKLDRYDCRTGRDEVSDAEYAALPGDEYLSLYLGSVMSLAPSGKYYTPWAHGNVDACPVCDGERSLPNPSANLARQEALATLASEIRWGAMEAFDAYANGGWPRGLIDELHILDRKAQHYKETLQCWRCDGIGSAEAKDDSDFWDDLTAELDTIGAWSESGEGDPCDVFIIMRLEEAEELAVRYERQRTGGQLALTIGE